MAEKDCNYPVTYAFRNHKSRHKLFYSDNFRQLEIDHWDATLLRTHYVDQRWGRNAKRFWAQSDQREDFVEA